MDEKTHFYSVVASALHNATEKEQKQIQALFEGERERKAEDILKSITSIIGYTRMLDILMGLEEVM